MLIFILERDYFSDWQRKYSKLKIIPAIMEGVREKQDKQQYFTLLPVLYPDLTETGTVI